MRRNAALLLVARLTSAGTTLAVLAVVGRLVGAEALGAVGVGVALGSVAAAISDGGTASLLVREAARRPEVAGRLLGAGLLVRVVTIPLTLLLVAVAATVVARDSVPTIVLVAAGVVGQQTAELLRSVFNADQRMHVSATHATIENLVWLATIVIALAAGWPLDRTFVLALGVWIGSVAVGLLLADRLAGVRPRLPDRTELRSLAGSAGPFAAFNVIGVAYSRIDTFLVAALLPGAALAAAGAYFSASRLVAAFEYLPEAVSRALYPELARRSVHDRASASTLLGRAARPLLVVGAAVPAVLIVGGGWLMDTLFGADAALAGPIIGALSLAIPVRFLGYLFGIALTSSDAQGRRVAAAGVALAIVLVIDIAFIPIVGLAAPIVAALGASVAVLALYATFVRRQLGATGIPASTAAACAGLSAGATVVGILLSPVVGPPVAAAVTLVAYAAVVAAGPLRSALRPPRVLPASGS